MKTKEIELIKSYYRAKEIFYRINIFFNTFNDNLTNFVDYSILPINTIIEDVYINQIENIINDVEIVCDFLKNNVILNESISSENADIIVNKIENIRKKYGNLNNNFLNELKSKYNFLDTNYEIYEIQKFKKYLNEKEKILFEFFESKILFYKNFEIYIEDIKKVIKIENEISLLKLNAYQTFIYNKLNEITYETFLNLTSINNILK